MTPLFVTVVLWCLAYVAVGFVVGSALHYGSDPWDNGKEDGFWLGQLVWPLAAAFGLLFLLHLAWKAVYRGLEEKKVVRAIGRVRDAIGAFVSKPFLRVAAWDKAKVELERKRNNDLHVQIYTLSRKLRERRRANLRLLLCVRENREAEKEKKKELAERQRRKRLSRAYVKGLPQDDEIALFRRLIRRRKAYALNGARPSEYDRGTYLEVKEALFSRRPLP